jgi:hypothetical protein
LSSIHSRVRCSARARRARLPTRDRHHEEQEEHGERHDTDAMPNPLPCHQYDSEDESDGPHQYRHQVTPEDEAIVVFVASRLVRTTPVNMSRLIQDFP